jgi:Domain of unknown function (DUF4403)
MKPIYYFLLIIFVATACKTAQPTGQEAKAPQESYQYTNQQVENIKHLSTINIPFEITMADVERQINAQVQGLVFEDNSFEDDHTDNFQCKVWKISPITVSAVKDTFFFTVPLKIWVNYRIQVLGMSQTKDTEFQVRLKFATKFSLSPNWEAQTQTSPNGFDWLTKPVLKVGPVDVPIGGIVGKFLSVKQEKMYKALDDAIAKNIEVKKYVVQAWNTAMQPYLVSEKYKTWLKVTPQEIVMTPLLTANNKVKATIGINAYTETVVGEKPKVNLVMDVPNLKVIKDIPSNFEVGIISEISHQEAAKMLADTMVGQKFSFQNGKFNVEVTSIDLYGQNDKLVIKAGLKGSVDGYIYFKGVPYYNPQNQTLSLKDFDYDLDTRNVLIKTANWLLQGAFAKKMKDAFVFQIGEQIESNKKEIQTYLTKNKLAKGVVLDGKLNEVLPDKVYLTSSSILAAVYAKGKMTLLIDGL